MGTVKSMIPVKTKSELWEIRKKGDKEKIITKYKVCLRFMF